MCATRGVLALSTTDAILRMRKNRWHTKHFHSRNGHVRQYRVQKYFDIWNVFLFWFRYVHLTRAIMTQSIDWKYEQRKMWSVRNNNIHID